MDHEGFEPPTPRSLDECSTTELMVPNLEKIGEDLEHFETLLNHLYTHTRCLDSGLKILVRVAHVAGVEPASPNGRGRTPNLSVKSGTLYLGVTPPIHKGLGVICIPLFFL